MSIRVGGAGANAALAFVETGLPVRLMGCVGEDRLGEWMRRGADRGRAGRRTGGRAGTAHRADRGAESDAARPDVPDPSRRQRRLGAGDDPGRRAGTATTCCCATTASPRGFRATRRARCSRPRARAGGAHVLRHRVGPTRTSRPAARAEVRGLLPQRRRVPAQRGRGARHRRRDDDVDAAARALQTAIGRLGGGQARRARVPGGRPRRRSCRPRPRRPPWPTPPARATRSTPAW